MILVLGCGACCYRAKILLLKENTMRKRQLVIDPKSAEQKVDKLIARRASLLERGEKLNRRSIQFLKDMNDRSERKRLMKKLLDAKLPLSNNVKRDLEIEADIRPLPPLSRPYAVD